MKDRPWNRDPVDRGCPADASPGLWRGRAAAAIPGGAGLAGVELAGDLSLAKDHHPIGMFQDLGQFRRDEQDGATLPGQAAQVPVDLGLGSDVDAAGGLVQDENFRLGQQPASQDHLLLVTARQLLDRLFGGSVAHLQLPGDLASGLLFPGPAGQKAPGPALQGRQHRVGADGQTRAEALAQAILGDIGDAGVQGLPRPADLTPVAVYPDQAAGGPQAEDRLGKFAAPGPHQAINAHDFTRSGLEIELSKATAPVGEPADLKADRTFLAGGGDCSHPEGETTRVAASRPTMASITCIGTDNLPGPGPYFETIPQDGNAVGQAKDLLLAMGNIEDAGAVRLQAGDLLEQPAGLLPAQGAGGFIQHHHLGVLPDGRRHLDHLAMSHAELGGGLANVDRFPHLANRLPGPAVHPVPIHQAEAAQREPGGQRHVLGNRKGGEQFRLLVDGDHALGAGGHRVWASAPHGPGRTTLPTREPALRK